MTRIRAEEDIFRDKPGQLGARTLLYRKGDYIREADAEMLGLASSSKPAPDVPSDKARRGPRDAPKKASRDKALNEPKEN